MAKSRRNYDYEPSYEDTVARAERRGGEFDPLYKDAKLFKAKQGANYTRILPGTFGKRDKYALKIALHRNVGPKDRRYLCLAENEHSPYEYCPVCDALAELGARATQDEKNELRPSFRFLYYIVDRDAEKEGVQLWDISGRADSEIAAQSVDRRNKSILLVAHPDKGFDLEFTRVGTTRDNTEYKGYRFARESSSLSDNEKRYEAWLDFAEDHPLPSILNFYKPEYIEGVLRGRTKPEPEEDKPSSRLRDDNGSDRKLERRRGRDDDEEEVRPGNRTRRDEDEERSSRSRRDERSGEDTGGEEEERPRRSSDRSGEDSGRSETRERSRRDDDEPRRPPRSKLAEDLDDEIPFKGGRRAEPNGRDDGRARLDDDADERPARRARDDEEEDERRPSSRSRGRDDIDKADDPDESARGRMRARLNRED